jgi:hypothetical protein
MPCGDLLELGVTPRRHRGLIASRPFQAPFVDCVCMIGGYCKNRKQHHADLSYSYDHPVIALKHTMTPAKTYSNWESLTVTSSLLKKVIFPAFRCSATTQRLGKTSGVTATLKCRWK